MTEHEITVTVTDGELKRMREWVDIGGNPERIDFVMFRRILDAAPKPIKVGDYVAPWGRQGTSWLWQVRHIDTDGHALCRATHNGGGAVRLSDPVLDPRDPSEFDTTWSDAHPIDE